MDFPQILFRNPFRVLDLYAEASLEQIVLQSRRLKAALGATGSYVSEKGFDSLPTEFPSSAEKKDKKDNPGKGQQSSSNTKSETKGTTSNTKSETKESETKEIQTSETPEAKPYSRTSKDIDWAVRTLQDPNTRIMCRLFWFTGDSAVDRRGIKILTESGLDSALGVWNKIYDSVIKKPSSEQISFLKGSYQNASVALLLYGKISEAVSLIEHAPFKWVDFKEICDNPRENAADEAKDAEVQEVDQTDSAVEEVLNKKEDASDAQATQSIQNSSIQKAEEVKERTKDHDEDQSKNNTIPTPTQLATPRHTVKSGIKGFDIDKKIFLTEQAEDAVTFTRQELLQMWYAKILQDGDIAGKLDNLGTYGIALQNAASELYPLAISRLEQVLVDSAKEQKTMSTVVEAIKKMMPQILDLRYLQVIPQKNFFAPYLTSHDIDTFLSGIDTKVFEYIITGPYQIKETDAITLEKFKDSLLQCFLALYIVDDFVTPEKEEMADSDFTESGKVTNRKTVESNTPAKQTSAGDSQETSDKAKKTDKGHSDSAKVSVIGKSVISKSQSSETPESKQSKTDSYKGTNRAKMRIIRGQDIQTAYQALMHLRTVLRPYIEILYDWYSKNLSKLVKQPQRVLSTTTQKKHTLEYGAPLLLAKYASVWYEYKFYCDSYPQGRSYQMCQEKFADDFFQQIDGSETVTPWQAYFLELPQSQHIPEVVERINAIRARIEQEKMADLERQKAQTFSSVKVLIAYYTQNPEACTNVEVWSRRALELAKSKSDYRQMAHVFVTDRYGREGTEQYRSILKKEQFKVSQAIVLLVFAAFLGLIVFKFAEIGMLALGFGFNYNAEIIGAFSSIALFIFIRIYLRRRNRDSAKNATIGFLISFILGLFTCVALWTLIPGQIIPEEDSNMIQDTIHDYFNPPSDQDTDYQEDNTDRV